MYVSSEDIEYIMSKLTGHWARLCILKVKNDWDKAKTREYYYDVIDPLIYKQKNMKVCITNYLDQ